MTAPAIHIEEDDLARPAVRALIASHVAEMRANSPACHVHAMEADALSTPQYTVFTAWAGETLLGCGALKPSGDDAGEIKSMRTAAGHGGRGVGAALLNHIVAEARARGYRRLSLETGRGGIFDAAVAFYAKHGFTFGGPFAHYAPNPFSQFMHRELDPKK